MMVHVNNRYTFNPWWENIDDVISCFNENNVNSSKQFSTKKITMKMKQKKKMIFFIYSTTNQTLRKTLFRNKFHKPCHTDDMAVL